MLRSKSLWSFLKLVTGAGFLLSSELLLALYVFFD